MSFTILINFFVFIEIYLIYKIIKILNILSFLLIIVNKLNSNLEKIILLIF